ncbi:MAG: hypothetical protein QE271_00840 [Bacteriovoracaceae bacterium]|nr:hypothetical protein [Bacteriovoracaceae bacterium]
MLELNENEIEGTPEENWENSHLEIKINGKRKKSTELGDYLTITVGIRAEYKTRCIKSFEAMNDSLDLSFDACFVSSKFKDDESYKDETEIFTDGKMHELYFFDGPDRADLKECCHEQIYLCLNPFPVKNQE